MLGEARQTAQYVVARLLERCRSARDAREAERPASYRPLLLGFADDCLCLLVVPDWPGAERVALALARAALDDVAHCGAPGAAQHGFDPSYASFLLDALGRVCTRVCAMRSATARRRRHLELRSTPTPPTAPTAPTPTPPRPTARPGAPRPSRRAVARPPRPGGAAAEPPRLRRRRRGR